MRPISDEDATREVYELRARCEDCGHEQALPNASVRLDDCCDLGDLRRFSLRSSDGTWHTHANPIRDTVDGPPQLLWLQWTDEAGLYVNGKLVEQISFRALTEEKPLTLINRFLAKAFEA